MRRPNLIRVYLKPRYSVRPGLFAHNHGVLGEVGVGVLRTRLNLDHAFEYGAGTVPQDSTGQNVPGSMRRFMGQVSDYVKPLLACTKNHLHILSRCSLSTENTVHPRPCNASPNMAHCPVDPRVSPRNSSPVNQGMDIFLEVLNALKVHFRALTEIRLSHLAVKRRPLTLSIEFRIGLLLKSYLAIFLYDDYVMAEGACPSAP